MTDLAWRTFGSPVGQLSVACSDLGVARVSFGLSPERSTGPSRQSAGPSRQSAGPSGRPGSSGRLSLLAAACDQLAGYFAGRRRAFDLPIDWSMASRVQLPVLSVLFDTVGYGETITYGSLARHAGLGDGGGGYSGGTGIEIKRWLLIFEGALPATLDWDPARAQVFHGWTGEPG